MGRKKEKKYVTRANAQVHSSEDEDEETDMTDRLWLVAAGIGCLMFSVYCYTTYPSVPGGDSGELLSAACEQGVAHPPGYPLWTMLSSLVIYILPFSPAYSVNVLTCACAALTSSLLFVVYYRFSTSWTIGMISSFLFSFAPLTWTWSITGEVFALNNLFIVLLILILTEFELSHNETHRRKMIYLGALVSGLGLTNQHTIILYLPAIICRVVYRVHQLKELSLRVALSVIGLVCLGISPYTYIVISSYKNTARWSWGDQTTTKGFFTHLAREEYGTFKLGSLDGQGHGFIMNLIEYKQSLLHQLSLPGYALACVGIVQTFIESNKGLRRTAQTCFAMMVCYITFFCWRANLDIDKPLMREIIERFWMQPNIVWVTLIALGCKLLYIRLNFKSFISRIMKVSLVVVVLALCVARGWNHCNHHTDTKVRDFANSVLDSLPESSLVLTRGDLPSGTLRYLQFCEGKRSDVTLVEQELMSYTWYIPKLGHLLSSVTFPGGRWHNIIGRTTTGLTTFNMLNLLDANIKTRPIFVCIGMQDQEDSWQTKYQLLPYGPCHQVVMKDHDWIEHTTPYDDKWDTSYNRLREGSWEGVADEEMWNAKISKALHLYNVATQVSDSKLKAQLFRQSYEEYLRAMKMNSVVPGYFHKNYALACEKMARFHTNSLDIKNLLKEAIKHFELYIPLGQDDSQIGLISQVVESLKSQIT